MSLCQFKRKRETTFFTQRKVKEIRIFLLQKYYQSTKPRIDKLNGGQKDILDFLFFKILKIYTHRYILTHTHTYIYTHSFDTLLSYTHIHTHTHKHTYTYTYMCI